jgi:copper chaperone CopZ
MMTMTELFYGPIEPTWLVHPQNRTVAKRPNGQPTNNMANPYQIYSDDAFTYRRHPYVQQNAVPYTNMVPQDGAVRGAVYPYQAQYFVHGGNPNAIVVEGMNQKQAQSPAKNGVLQPWNGVNMQTLHFMVPLCCEKCEDKVKNQLLDLDDVQRVTCDQWKQKVSVTSTIAPEKLLARLQKLKKRSTLWPQQVAGAVKVFNGNQVNQQAQQQQNNKSNNQNENQILTDENSSVQEDC